MLGEKVKSTAILSTRMLNIFNETANILGERGHTTHKERAIKFGKILIRESSTTGPKYGVAESIRVLKKILQKGTHIGKSNAADAIACIVMSHRELRSHFAIPEIIEGLLGVLQIDNDDGQHHAAYSIIILTRIMAENPAIVCPFREDSRINDLKQALLQDNKEKKSAIASIVFAYPALQPHFVKGEDIQNLANFFLDLYMSRIENLITFTNMVQKNIKSNTATPEIITALALTFYYGFSEEEKTTAATLICDLIGENEQADTAYATVNIIRLLRCFTENNNPEDPIIERVQLLCSDLHLKRTEENDIYDFMRKETNKNCPITSLTIFPTGQSLEVTDQSLGSASKVRLDNEGGQHPVQQVHNDFFHGHIG